MCGKQKSFGKSFLRVVYMMMICLIAAVLSGPYALAKTNPGKTEILWDNWGVPHIFGKDTAGAFYAFGWAQMKCHGDLILKLYGEARGRASEYWGESNLQSDIDVRQLGIPKRGKEWFNAYSPEFRGYLEAFAKGMNDYAAKNKDKLNKDRLVVLPVTTADVLAHTQRVIHMDFVGGNAFYLTRQWNRIGSNAWAIAPSNSASGNAMLLANPHLPWSGYFMFFEAQFTAPGINAYGVTLVGFPMHVIAFNDHLGWSHTVNVSDGSDLYELTLKEGGYLLDGKKKNFKTETQTVKIKTGDGSFREQKLVIETSVFGPVVAAKREKALALKIAGLDRPLIWQQWFDMARATNLKEFEKALKQLQIPMFNVVYADRDGHIMLLHNAALPKRSKGDSRFWDRIVPGDKSETLWTGYHPYGDLPRIADPANGWIQNTNDPPWTSTYPMVLKPGNFTPYTSMNLKDYSKLSMYMFRSQRSIRMLREDKSISFEELIRYKHSTRMELADRLLDDLSAAVKEHGGDMAGKALKVLEKWDRSTDTGSRGGVLFKMWIREMRAGFFAREWEPGSLTATPDGLKTPKMAVTAFETAAGKVIQQYGALDVPWGTVHRLRIAGGDFPGNGGSGILGVFRTMHYAPGEDGKLIAAGGDSYVAAVEFSNPVKARVILNYGNSSQPGSPHRGDQLELVSKKKMRPAWRTRAEIEKHLEKKEIF
ncbi:MAG: acylase [bacterium]|nr:acylase [bacterium]